MKFIAIDNIEEVLQNHPRFTKDFTNWFTNKLSEGQGAEGLITDEFVKITLKVQPRILYDFFDEKHITITVDKDLGKYVSVVYINDSNKLLPDDYATLHEAEIAGFLFAIKTYENE